MRAIHVLFEAFLEAGDELLLPVPTYTMYEVFGASATDASIVTVQAADDLQFPSSGSSPQLRRRPRSSPSQIPTVPQVPSRSEHSFLKSPIARRRRLFSSTKPTSTFTARPSSISSVSCRISSSPELFPRHTVLRACASGVRRRSRRKTMRWIRRVLSPYSVNSLALACLPPALHDTTYLDWYVSEVLVARSEFESVLDSCGLRRWPSRANFVLVHIGEGHAKFVELMRAAGVLVRDRSSDPGCDGRVRITIGTREQMRDAAVALKEAVHTMKIGVSTK